MGRWLRKTNLLAILKAELAFVEGGGYRAPQQAAWRPQFIFQDSPTCPNFKNVGKWVECSRCALVGFIPKGSRQERFPCRHIPLDEAGQTLDFLYRTGTEEETHGILAHWLKTTIARLEWDKAFSPEAGVPWESRALAARSGR